MATNPGAFNVSSIFANRKVFALVISLLMLFGVACSSAPVQEMSDARQAIEAARAAGAELRAANDLDKARELLEAAETLLDERHFNKARKSAAAARDQAIRARELAEESIAP